jgi:hypothetical protein
MSIGVRRGAVVLSLLAASVALACAPWVERSGASAPASSAALQRFTPRPPPIRLDAVRAAARDRRDRFSPPKRRPIAAATLPGGKWSSLGPAAIGPSFLAGGGIYGGVNSGRITALVEASTEAHPARVVAASAGGGIWTSDDNGAHWDVRTDGASDLAIGSLAVDPSNASHLIAGTGEADQSADSFPGNGILVSSDDGQSWTLQNPGGVFTGVDVAQVAIDPSNSKHQFAATSSGLFITSDGGTTWAKPSDASYKALDGNVTAVAVNPATPATVYLGGGNATIGKSTDGGVTWKTANSGVGKSGTFPLIALAIAPSMPATLYASVGSTAAVALYKSTNSGETWSALTAAPDYTGQAYAYESGTAEQGWYDNVVAVDPTDSSHVLAGGIALVESKDGGSTWTNVNGGPFFGGANKIHPDHHALGFRSDGRVWIGDDGGVFLYTPSSAAVANANGNLDITQFYFGFNAVAGTVLAGSQDNGSARTSSALLEPWTGIWAGDGGPSAITPNESSLQFIESDQNLYTTSDAFGTELSPRNITPPELGLFTPPMIVVPNAGTPTEPTVFYGGGDLWRTTNPSASLPTWTKVTSVAKKVSAIAASPTNPSVVYVGFANGVIDVSTDGGSTFAALAAEPSPQKFVTGISVNPENEKEIVASFSFNDTRSAIGAPHVATYAYTSAPGSGTWSIISGSLPEGAVSRVVYDNGALVAATDGGVYATSEAAGESTMWTRTGNGLPAVQVQDLFVNSTGVYAVTHGRGAWLLPFHPNSPTVSSVEPNGGPVAGGTTVTITGTRFTGASAVTFGSTAAASFTVNSATSITAASPAGSGAVHVTVTSEEGESATTGADVFTYTSPTVAKVSPAEGPLGGGTAVTITGTNLGEATGVKFAGTAATSFKVNSATSVTATSPAGKGVADITVTTPEGTSPAGAADRFTYVLAPTVTKVKPNTGPASGGTSVTITGTNFTAASAVVFGATPASSVAVKSSTVIIAVAPAETAGTVDITVTTAGGTSGLSAADHYKVAPVITHLSPNEGPSAGGTSVTVTGAGFLSGKTGDSFKFGTTKATSVNCTSSTECLVVAPAHAAGTIEVKATISKLSSAKTSAANYKYV